MKYLFRYAALCWPTGADEIRIEPSNGSSYRDLTTPWSSADNSINLSMASTIRCIRLLAAYLKKLERYPRFILASDGVADALTPIDRNDPISPRGAMRDRNGARTLAPRVTSSLIKRERTGQ